MVFILKDGLCAYQANPNLKDVLRAYQANPNLKDVLRAYQTNPNIEASHALPLTHFSAQRAKSSLKALWFLPFSLQCFGDHVLEQCAISSTCGALPLHLAKTLGSNWKVQLKPPAIDIKYQKLQLRSLSGCNKCCTLLRHHPCLVGPLMLALVLGSELANLSVLG